MSPAISISTSEQRCVSDVNISVGAATCQDLSAADSQKVSSLSYVQLESKREIEKLFTRKKVRGLVNRAEISQNSPPLTGAKFQRFLSGKIVFQDSKIQIREFRAHLME